MSADPNASARPHTERWFVAIIISLGFGAAVFVFLSALSVPIAIALSILFAVGASMRVAPRLPASLDGVFSRRRSFALAWATLAVLCIAALFVLAFFMVHPEATWASAQASSDFMTHHSCLTAYAEAARFASEHAPNIYAPPLYRPDPHAARMLDGFQVDPYMYPPTFLLLPATLRLVTADFLRERLIWYALDFACVAGALLALARWVGGDHGARLALLVPAVLISIPTRMSLQMGNFQLMAASMCILAMIAFERRRAVGGSALLAFAIGAKLYPGLLLVYLLARRRYREVGLTIGFLFVYLALAALFFGPRVLGVFVGFEAPRLATGAAFGMLHMMPWTVTINESVYGLVLKLGMLGVPGASFKAAGIVAWLYTLAVIAIAFALGKKPDADPLATATTWVALLAAASLRAPFLPQEYGLFLPIWLLSLVVARLSNASGKTVAIAGLAWAGLNVLWPLEQFNQGAMVALLVTAIGQAIAWTLIARTIARTLRGPAAATA